MSEPISTAATAATAAVLSVSGLPPAEVVAWSFMGGLVAVWLSADESVSLTGVWVLRALARLLVSTASGIALSAITLGVVSHFEMLAWLQYAPQWAVAAVIAALIFKAAPLVVARVTRLLGGKDAAV